MDTLAASDHFICYASIEEISGFQTTELPIDSNQHNFLLKFKYDNMKTNHYKRLLEMSHRIYFSDHNVNTLNNNFVPAIKEAASLSGMLKIYKMSQNRLIKENRHWYNDSCKKLNQELKKA